MNLFLSELDIEILYMLARGLTQNEIAGKACKTAAAISKRVSNMQNVFGAATTPHLVAIAIASDVIRVPDLNDVELSDAVHVQSEGGGEKQTYHLLSKRLEILESAVTTRVNRYGKSGKRHPAG